MEIKKYDVNDSNTYKIFVVNNDGIDVFGSPSYDSEHGNYIYEYITSKYGDIPFFKRFSNDTDKTILSDNFVAVTGSIIVLNGISKYGKYDREDCNVFLPEKVYESTKVQLKKLIPHFNKFLNVNFFVEREEVDENGKKYFLSDPVNYVLSRNTPDDWDGISKLPDYVTDEDIDNIFNMLEHQKTR